MVVQISIMVSLSLKERFNRFWPWLAPLFGPIYRVPVSVLCRTGFCSIKSTNTSHMCKHIFPQDGDKYVRWISSAVPGSNSMPDLVIEDH